MPSKQTTPEEMDQFGWHEALDRAHIIGEIFDLQLANHPVIQSHPQLKTLAEDIGDKMG